jgi:transaldolase/glucose-6-phosphate isomerase
MNPLLSLATCGQSPWLDSLGRQLIQSGTLKALIDHDGLKGVTSNPSIFEKAIAETDDYSAEIARFQSERDHSVAEIYERLVIADIRDAADALRPLYQATNGADGFVSLECSPYLAHDTEGTVAEGLRLWAAVDRPNLMIKVPATREGLPAIRRLIGRGLNVNVTLLFSLTVHQEVIEAYLSGLEDLSRAGGDPSRVASVASFFVSRIDTAVDRRLDSLADERVAAPLRGQVAIASAKLAYVQYQAHFRGPRWDALAARGARTQRLLWASTSTKSPAFKDTLYVEALIGRETVDTLPPATLNAFRDHGEVRPDAILQDVAAAREVLADIARQGLSLDAITEDLVAEGVRAFAADFDKLLGAVAEKRRLGLEGDHPAMAIWPGDTVLESAIAAELEVWRAAGSIRRLWAGTGALWTGQGEEAWLGWLDIVDRELADLDPLRAFAAEIGQDEVTDVVVLGMGGSSLGPEVLGLSFGASAGKRRFHILDSTDPAQILALEAELDLPRTLFIVSSKSGGTLEPNIFLDYFLDRLSKVVGVDQVGRHLVAVTDPGSSLEARAQALGFAHVFHGDPRIGGRYSVLSKFGLAPAAAMGLDIGRLLARAQTMVRSCGPDAPPSDNPGVRLGVTLGVAARHGRDKVTLIASPGVADLGAWLEQLLAESTGKQGRGLIPLAGEPLGPPEVYGADRVFIYLELESGADPDQRLAIETLKAAGHPVVTLVLKDLWSLGSEFFRWEMATAVAGAVLGINPFDQPDVEASKQKTNALITAYGEAGSLPPQAPLFVEDGLALYADPRNAAELGPQSSLTAYLRRHLSRLEVGDYVALLAYIARTSAHSQVLDRIRARIRDRTRAATCLGFGPRFQHSTGQAYKGGPNSGVFLQITCDDPVDLAVPGHPFSFGVVKAAQARGDFEVLAERGRRLIRIHLNDSEAGLVTLARAIDAALD